MRDAETVLAIIRDRGKKSSRETNRWRAEYAERRMLRSEGGSWKRASGTALAAYPTVTRIAHV